MGWARHNSHTLWIDLWKLWITRSKLVTPITIRPRMWQASIKTNLRFEFAESYPNRVVGAVCGVSGP